MKNYRVWAALLVIYFAWGSTYLAIRFAVESIPPFLLAGFRFFLAGLIVYTWRRLAGDPNPTLEEWKGPAIMGLFLLVGGNGGVVWAEQRVTSGVTALLIGATPFWIALVDWLRPGGTRPNWKIALGLVVGFAGITLLIQSSQQASAAERIDLLGALVLLLAAFSWAIGTVYGSRAVMPKSPFMATGIEMLVGGGVLLLIAVPAGEWSRFSLAAVTPHSFWAWFYLMTFASVFVLSVYTWLVRNTPLPLLSTYAYVNPLVAIFLGHMLAQEPLTWRILFSASVIISAVVLINAGRFARPRRQIAAATSGD